MSTRESIRLATHCDGTFETAVSLSRSTPRFGATNHTFTTCTIRGLNFALSRALSYLPRRNLPLLSFCRLSNLLLSREDGVSRDASRPLIVAITVNSRLMPPRAKAWPLLHLLCLPTRVRCAFTMAAHCSYLVPSLYVARDRAGCALRVSRMNLVHSQGVCLRQG